MRPIFSWLILLLVFFCSCNKSDVEATPSIDMTGSWELASSMTLPDSTWSKVTAADSAVFAFNGDGQFNYNTKTWATAGHYKVIADGQRIKLIITGADSLSQYLQVERTSDSTIKVDDWLKAVTKGYTSRQFVKRK